MNKNIRGGYYLIYRFSVIIQDIIEKKWELITLYIVDL